MKWSKFDKTIRNKNQIEQEALKKTKQLDKSFFILTLILALCYCGMLGYLIISK